MCAKTCVPFLQAICKINVAKFGPSCIVVPCCGHSCTQERVKLFVALWKKLSSRKCYSWYRRCEWDRRVTDKRWLTQRTSIAAWKIRVNPPYNQRHPSPFYSTCCQAKARLAGSIGYVRPLSTTRHAMRIDPTRSPTWRCIAWLKCGKLWLHASDGSMRQHGTSVFSAVSLFTNSFRSVANDDYSSGSG